MSDASLLEDSLDVRWRLRTLAAPDVVEAVDRAESGDGADRALGLLSVALPDAGREALRRLPIGRRDRLLLQLRRKLLGSSLQAHLRCPGCTTLRTFALEIDEDLLPLDPRPSDDPSTAEARLSRSGMGGEDQNLAEAEWAEEPYRLVVRAADSRDEDWLRTLRPPAPVPVGPEVAHLARRLALVRRLVVQAHRLEDDEWRQVDPLDLPDDVLAQVGEIVDELDPLAVVPLQLECTVCGLTWQYVLDIADLVLQEIKSLANRLLYDVHLLATAYGWDEDRILALSGRRRNYYLERIPSTADESLDDRA